MIPPPELNRYRFDVMSRPECQPLDWRHSSRPLSANTRHSHALQISSTQRFAESREKPYQAIQIEKHRFLPCLLPTAPHLKTSLRGRLQRQLPAPFSNAPEQGPEQRLREIPLPSRDQFPRAAQDTKWPPPFPARRVPIRRHSPMLTRANAQPAQNDLAIYSH